MLDTLCSRLFIPDMILHIPTKAILRRSPLTKINFLLCCSYMRDKDEYIAFVRNASIILYSIKCIYAHSRKCTYSIIEKDDALDKIIRRNAVYLLARTLQEHRLDYGVAEFAPILLNLWKTRERLIQILVQ